MEEFKEKFDNLLVEKLSIRKEDIVPQAKFVDDLGADSLDMAELTIEFEKVFGLNITDDEAEQIITVRDAEEFLGKKLTGNS